MNKNSLPRIGIITVGAALSLGAAAAADAAHGAPQVSSAASSVVVLVDATPESPWGGSVSPAAHLNAIKFKGVDFQVSDEQLKAFNALPHSVQLKLRAPSNGQVMSADEINGLSKGAEGNTIMCAW
jgi:hypothetical protein